MQPIRTECKGLAQSIYNQSTLYFATNPPYVSFDSALNTQIISVDSGRAPMLLIPTIAASWSHQFTHSRP